MVEQKYEALEEMYRTSIVYDKALSELNKPNKKEQDISDNIKNMLEETSKLDLNQNIKDMIAKTAEYLLKQN
jgi:hypothetical protein